MMQALRLFANIAPAIGAPIAARLGDTGSNTMSARLGYQWVNVADDADTRRDMANTRRLDQPVSNRQAIPATSATTTAAAMAQDGTESGRLTRLCCHSAVAPWSGLIR